MRKKQKNTSLLFEKKGVAAVEAALVLPVLILLIVCGIEFGLYFLKSSIAQRAVSITSNSVQLNPVGTLYQDALQQGLSFIDLGILPNYICAKSYKSQSEAVSKKCSPGEWITEAPAGVVSGEGYYVAITVFIKQTPISLLSNYLKDIYANAVVPVNFVSSNFLWQRVGGEVSENNSRRIVRRFSPVEETVTVKVSGIGAKYLWANAFCDAKSPGSYPYFVKVTMKVQSSTGTVSNIVLCHHGSRDETARNSDKFYYGSVGQIMIPIPDVETYVTFTRTWYNQGGSQSDPNGEARWEYELLK